MASVRQLSIFVALVNLVWVVSGQTTTLSMAQSGGSSPSSSPYGVPLSSSIVFTCTALATNYSEMFTYAELHAQVSGNDVIVCRALASGSCENNSQSGQFSSRSIAFSIPTSLLNTTFTMTNAVVSDSLNYYCIIVTDSQTYMPTSGTFQSSLLVYALPSTPTCSFSTGSNVFVAGSALPSIVCSANVGAPYGWLKITSSGTIGVSSTAPYPSFLYLVSNTTTLQTDGTYLMTYTLAYQNSGSASTYTLTSANNGDYFTCNAYNSYGNTYYPTLGAGYTSSSPLTIVARSPISNITLVSLTNAFTLSSRGSTSYSLSATQGATLLLLCTASGYSPTYAWTRVVGTNTISTINAQTLSVSFVFPETLVIQCNASNTINSLGYGSSQTASVTITITSTVPTSISITAQNGTSKLDCCTDSNSYSMTAAVDSSTLLTCLAQGNSITYSWSVLQGAALFATITPQTIAIPFYKADRIILQCLASGPTAVQSSEYSISAKVQITVLSKAEISSAQSCAASLAVVVSSALLTMVFGIASRTVQR